MKFLISYEEYGNLLEELIALIKLSGRTYKYIYGIPKGGLPIAIHLAHNLNAELFMDLHEFKSHHYTLRTDDFLVVDDICDTGKTLKQYRKAYGGRFDTLAMFYKPTRSPDVKPVYYVRETDKWIVFPWERVDEKPNREGYDDSGRTESKDG